MIIFTNPYPDELLYSWVQRLAERNAISLKFFTQRFLEAKTSERLLYDIRHGFPTLCEAMFPSEDQGVKYFELSTAPFDAIFLTPQDQYRLICDVFEPRDGINQKFFGHIQNIKICPKCLEEDKQKYGEWYLHRAHHLEGVCKCYRHGMDLLEYDGKHGQERCYENYKPIRDCSTDIKYAQYSKLLLDANIQTNLKELQRIIINKAYQEGMLVNPNAKNRLTIKVNTDMEDVKKHLFYSDSVTPTRLIPILMHFFPDVNELTKQLPQTDQIVSEYICHCGKKYYQNWWGHKFGLRSCQCQPYDDINEKFRDMVKLIKHDEYYLGEDFTSMGTPIAIWHKTCDSYKSYDPREFLFGSAKCECEVIVTYGEARRRVEHGGKFKLIDFTKANDLATIESVECGHTFTCRYDGFVKSPKCRVCHPAAMNSAIYEERVRMLVGDEYTVISPYENSKTKIRIRHNLCGCTQEYDPNQFLSGQRCRDCNFFLKNDKLDQYLRQYSHGRYSITDSEYTRVTVLDRQTEQTMQLSNIRVLQEILRPTPSDILPVENPDKTIKITSSWDDALNLFKEYAQTHNVIELENETKYKGFGLGRWVKNQRMAYNRGDLSDSSIKLLEDAGFIFDKKDELWVQRYEMLKSIFHKQKVYSTTECDGVQIGCWLWNMKKAYRRGGLTWDKIDLMQRIDIDILCKQNEHSIFSKQVRSMKVTYDEERRMILIKSNTFIPTNSSIHKLHKWIPIGEVFYIGLCVDDTTQKELDVITNYCKNNKYKLLINGKDFYRLTGLDIFDAPEKYEKSWHIEDGIMYTNNPQSIQVVFDLKTYQNL